MIEPFERTQVEQALRGAMSSVERTRRYLEGDMLASAYEHPGAADALHDLDECAERLDRAAAVLGFDPDDLKRALF
jgi:hypothetical protein